MAVVAKHTSTELSKSERTRQRILDAAAGVFSEQGYGARLSDIAERAGMKAGSLYYHFDSREALVRDVLRLGIQSSWDEVALAVGRLPQAATGLQRIAAAIRAHTLAVVGRSAYATAQARIVGQLPADLAREHRKDMREYGAYWDDLLRAAQASGEIDVDVDLLALRMLAFGANWTAEWFRASDAIAADDLANQAVRIVLHGVAPYGRAAPPVSARRPVR